MPVTHVNFRYGCVVKPDDGKNCPNCAECHDGPNAKAICLECTRFGHGKGTRDNWRQRGEE